MANNVDIHIKTTAETGDIKAADAALDDLGRSADDAAKSGLSLGEAFSASALGNLGASLISDAAGSVKQMALDAVNLADKLADLAGKAGTSASALQRIGNAAADNGSSMEATSQALAKLTLNSQKALDGSAALADSFERLGITTRDIQTLSADQLFLRIADSVSQTNDRGRAFADVVSLMGEESANMFSTLSLGSDEIRKLGDSFGVFSDQAIADLDRAKQEIDKFKASTTIAFGEMLASAREWWSALTDNDAITAGFEGMLGVTREQQDAFREMGKLGKDAALDIVEGVDRATKRTSDLGKAADQTADSLQKLSPPTAPSNTSVPLATSGPKPLGQNTAQIDAALGQNTARIDSALGDATAKANEALTQSAEALTSVANAVGEIGPAITTGTEPPKQAVADVISKIPEQIAPVTQAVNDLGAGISSGLTDLTAAITTQLASITRQIATMQSQIANLR